MRIVAKKSSPCREYAALELQKYVRKISSCTILPEIEWTDALPNLLSDDVIVLGTLDELSLDTSDLFDPFVEDILDVCVENACGYIAGSLGLEKRQQWSDK